jgi:glutamine synthetase
MQLSQDQIIEKVKSFPGGKVKLAVTDTDGILRGKVIHLDKFLSVVNGGFGFCDVIFGWDCADSSYEGVDFTGWHTGYPDANASIDLNTFRQVPWDGDIPFFLADFNGLNVCPRSLLKKVRQKSLDMGYSPIFAQEFEWFNFEEDSNDLHDTDFHRPKPMTQGMFGYSILRSSQRKDFFNELFDLLDKFNVTIEGIHTETGPGVYEAAIMYKDILEAADRAVLFKASAKEIGHEHGIIPSFMAKWNEKLPGCSGHIHQSLWKDGKNIFFDPNGNHKMSSLMESYLAGLLHCLPELLPMYAPNMNSYKRLVEGMWAPTTITWGIDNRTTAVRVLPGSDKSTRIELRVPGSDANPYLAQAASLASGLYGIEKGLKLTQPACRANGYEDKSNGVLPANLWESTQRMKNSEVANSILGEDFVKHFTQTREWEWKQAAQVVTDWEVKRYFEII